MLAAYGSFLIAIAIRGRKDPVPVHDAATHPAHGLFGVLATMLAIIGLYGVMAYTVARRTREIGIRMALGALQGNVIWMIMREVLLVLAVGVVIGVPAAMGLSRLVRSQLYGLTPYDPGTLVGATVVLAAVACLAGLIPALRASRIDPTQALRYE
jgi:ABC-type antimicrobial peptide transport system permease subunit